jgi:heterodisulfide reductase subunit B2
MKVSYYPGCSLEGTAADYELSIQGVHSALEIALEELPDWSCCGSTAAHSINHDAAINLAGRNVAIAEEIGLDLVVPCPLCFNRLKTAEKVLTGPERDRYAISLSGDRIKIYDLADFLAQPNNLETIKRRVVRPLSDLKAVCYYGCQSSRPPKVTDAANCENPMSMDRILRTLGADPIQWSFKTDCCGASHILPRQDVAFTMIERLYQRAVQAGAECFVVSCQMCQLNLDAYQFEVNKALGTDYTLPVVYFTDLIGLAIGLPDAEKWFSKKFVDPAPLFAESLTA